MNVSQSLNIKIRDMIFFKIYFILWNTVTSVSMLFLSFNHYRNFKEPYFFN